MKIIEGYKSLIRNPIAWVLVGLVAFGFYNNYTHGKRLDRICDMVLPLTEIGVGHSIHDVSDKPGARLEDLERLDGEDSVEGHLWRWQKFEGRRVARICAEPGDDPKEDG